MPGTSETTVHGMTHQVQVSRVRLSPEQIAALDRSITPTRFGTFRQAAGGDQDLARDLYAWDRRLATAFLHDLGMLEVALRNAMHEQLAARFGEEWYRNMAVPLDDAATRALKRAWSQCGSDRTPGRIVAQCTFGFWRGLLEKGGYIGDEPRRQRCNYEEGLWRPALHKAFPRARIVAKADGRPSNRAYVLDVVSRLNALRNRVAHHEPLINGYPLSGQGQRRTPSEGYADCQRLADMIDRDLLSVLDATSEVPTLLLARPTTAATGVIATSSTPVVVDQQGGK